MKVLVAGATGFVGSHLCGRFLSLPSDREVIGTYRSGSTLTRVHRFAPETRLVKMDMTKPSEMRKALKSAKPHVVVNAAAYGVSHDETAAENAMAVNSLAVSDLISECRKAGVRRFVQIGTSLEYGNAGGRVGEDSPLAPMSLYAATKAAGSAIALAEARKPGLEILVLRPFWMWGAGEDRTKVVPQVLRACITDQPVKLTDCEQVRDYLHVADAAAAMAQLSLLKKLPSGNIVNIGSGQKIRLKDFLKRIAGVFCKEKLLKFGALKKREGEAAVLVADTKRLERCIGPIAPEAWLFRGRVLEAADFMRGRR